MSSKLYCDPEFEADRAGCRGVLLGLAVSLVIWGVVFGAMWYWWRS
jgi:hypothetical protein